MTKPKTFRRTLVRTILRNTLIVAAVLAFLVLGASTQGRDDAPARPDVENGPAALMEEHDCWSGEAPADMEGQIPGHVVVTIGNKTRYAGPRMVSKALAQIFEGADHGLTVHGFCR